MGYSPRRSTFKETNLVKGLPIPYKWQLWLFALMLILTACSTSSLETPTLMPVASLPTAVPTAETAPAEPPSDLVVTWNETMLTAVRNGLPAPTIISRSMFMTHAAMYDAWTAYDSTAVPTMMDASIKRPAAEHTNANKAAAISQAAYHVLVAQFPIYEKRTAAFQNLMQDLGYDIVSKGDPTTPAGIGYLAAKAMLSSRADDGSNAPLYSDVRSDYYPELYKAVNSADPNSLNALRQPDFDPNHWTPLRVPTGLVSDNNGRPAIDLAEEASYVDQSFLTPHWGAVTPFALTSPNEFRPAPPPQTGSDEPYVDALGNQMTNHEACQQQINEILSISATLTDRQKALAEFWADGPRSETPPGHWNAIAHGISVRDNHTIDDDIKLYFALNGAVFDGGIAAWESKRYYDYIRPITAIQLNYAGQMIEAWGGPNMGTQLIPGEAWQPYQSLTFVTPGFAEYVSGHSVFSAAAAEVLTMFTGSDAFYDGVSMTNQDFDNDGQPDMLGQHTIAAGSFMFEEGPAEPVVLRWETFKDAANEAGVSRRYGGIHFQDGDLNGRIMGQQIGNQAFNLAQQYWNGTINK